MSIDAAIILAAGRGERLQPLTSTLAQALVPVAGRSLLERSIDRLNEHGVKNIVVNVHHLGHQIADRLNGRARILHEECLLGTGGSVKNALPLLGGGSFFVLNGDSLWTDGSQPMLKRLEDRWNPRRMDAQLLLHLFNEDPAGAILGVGNGLGLEQCVLHGSRCADLGLGGACPYADANAASRQRRGFGNYFSGLDQLMDGFGGQHGQIECLAGIDFVDQVRGGTELSGKPAPG